MTTIMYQGMPDGEKPSSRVMHPPGGSSSNIFGDPEPAVQRSKQEAASVDTGSPNAAGQSRAKEEGNTQNRLFGDSPAENTPPPAPVAETPPEAPPPQPMEAPQPVEALVEAPGSTTGNRRNQTTLDLSQPERPGSAGITPCRKRFFEHEGRGGEKDEEEKSEKERHKAEGTKPPRGAYNPITLQDYPEGYIETSQGHPALSDPNKGRGQYNPITGEEYNESPRANAASKSRQPPGGASSITF